MGRIWVLHKGDPPISEMPWFNLLLRSEVLTNESPGQSDVSRAFSAFCWAICCLTWIQEGNILILNLLHRDDGTVKANVSISGAECSPMAALSSTTSQTEIRAARLLYTSHSPLNGWSQRWKHDMDTVVGSLLFLNQGHVDKREMGLAVCWCCQRVN